MALAQRFRIHTDREFRDIFTRGQSARCSFAFVKFRSQAGPHPRVAVVVGKKVSKLSVVRHRIKRRITAALQYEGVERLPYDMIWSVQKDVTGISFSDILRSVKDVLGFIGRSSIKNEYKPH